MASYRDAFIGGARSFWPKPEKTKTQYLMVTHKPVRNSSVLTSALFLI